MTVEVVMLNLIQHLGALAIKKRDQSYYHQLLTIHLFSITYF